MHTAVSYVRGGFSRTFPVVDFLDHVQSHHARAAREGQLPHQYGGPAVITLDLEGRDPGAV
jgi:hypothetical protein